MKKNTIAKNDKGEKNERCKMRNKMWNRNEKLDRNDV